MLAYRYEIRPSVESLQNAHFELRIDDANRLFHLVFRLETDQIAVNQMENGAWGIERTLLDHANLQAIDAFYIWVVGPFLKILVNGKFYTFPMNRSSEECTLYAASSGMQHSISLDEVTFNIGEVHSGEVKPEINSFRLAGREIIIPATCDPVIVAHVFLNSRKEMHRYINFLTSRRIYENASDLLVVDIDSSLIHLSLVAALLLPKSRVIKATDSSELSFVINAIAQVNGLNNIECMELSEVLAHLGKPNTETLIQGGQVYQALGAKVSSLSYDQRMRLSIWTETLELVPAYVALPVKNLSLTYAKTWELRANAATRTSGKSCLDVVIAAYNAGEFITDCVGSILASNRPDINIVLVDDGSTDDTWERVHSVFGEDRRIRYERKLNGGCASARNFGRLRSEASHIAFVDADDFVSEDFFSTLFDLALYTGAEMVQGGFDLFDADSIRTYTPSYEEEIFKDRSTHDFGRYGVMRLSQADIVSGQPSIWRRVYRRDFLDAKGIVFLENVRAYDDYSFQLITAKEARDVYHVPAIKYHYRQHPGQDIKQGDERHFNMLTMFYHVLQKAITEGWETFDFAAQSILSSINWSISVIRPDLKDLFIRASARLCAIIRKCFGSHLFSDLGTATWHPNFPQYLTMEYDKLKAEPDGAFWHLLSGSLEHPDMLRMRWAAKKAMR